MVHPSPAYPAFLAHMRICSLLRAGPNVSWWVFAGDMSEDAFRELNNAEVSKYLLEDDPLDDFGAVLSILSIETEVEKFWPAVLVFPLVLSVLCLSDTARCGFARWFPVLSR